MTCDNASNNDTMVAHLEAMLEAFGGDYARTRCFLHILNLTAKSLLKQFDVKVIHNVEEVDDDVRRLLEMARKLALEDSEGVGDGDSGETRDDEDDEIDSDDEESWVDEVASLDDEERGQFEEEVRPVKMTLAKVSQLAAYSEEAWVLVSRFDRFAAWRSRLSTQQPSSFRLGTRSWRSRSSLNGSSPATYEHAGTRLMICST